MQNILINEAIIAKNYILKQFNMPIPNTAIILGSGLSSFTDNLQIIKSIPFTEIPNFPINTVTGHKGRLSLVQINNATKILVLEGRIHYYEGYTIQQVVLPIVILYLLQIKYLIITNAAGAINQNFNVNDFMLITDHINFTGKNPLIGINNEKLGTQFLDLSNPYDSNLINVAKNTAKILNVSFQQGVYLGVSGPSYETKAEINAFRILGADAVGMSTIFETIIANYFNIKVLGISYITNMATGITNTKHSHLNIVKNATNNKLFNLWLENISINLKSIDHLI